MVSQTLPSASTERGRRKAYQSYHGVDVGTEVQTGLVKDFEVLSTYCHSCSLERTQLGTGTPELEEWMNHQTDCGANFTSSSKAMEAEAARRIWIRSTEKYNLRYPKILSEGDAQTFAVMEQLQPYRSDHPNEKLNCVNHADKRMGTALWKATADHKLGGNGWGCLSVKPQWLRSRPASSPAEGRRGTKTHSFPFSPRQWVLSASVLLTSCTRQK